MRAISSRTKKGFTTESLAPSSRPTIRSVSLARAVRKMTGVCARSGSFRMPLQMSRPSESGSMISSRMRSGRTWRPSSIAPRPVCSPVSEQPSFSRLYLRSANRSTTSSMSRIFFISATEYRSSVTGWLRRGEFGIKRFLPHHGFFHRKCEIERGPLSDRAFHARRAVVRGHQVLDNREAQPGAAELARARLVHPVEALEQARQILLRNADPGIAHKELDHLGPRRGADRDFAARGRVLDRVIQQVAQHLRHGFAIAPNHGIVRSRLFAQTNPRFLRDRPHHFQSVVNHVIDQVRAKLEFLALLLDAREREQIFGEPRQPLGVVADDGEKAHVVIGIVERA